MVTAVTYEKVKSMFEMVRDMNGEITLNYLPISAIDTPEKCYGIYYSGYSRIVVSSGCVNIGGRFYYPESVEDYMRYVGKVYDVLSNDVGRYVEKALDILELDAEELKYFVNGQNGHKAFKVFYEEVCRLSNSGK